MWEWAHVGFGGRRRQRNGPCTKHAPRGSTKHCKIYKKGRDAPKVAILEAPCAQMPGRSITRPPGALLPETPLGSHPASRVSQSFRSGKSQNESFPNFSNFRPEFCSEFCSEIFPNFSRIFRASFRGRRRVGDQKKFTKNPRHFSMQNS